mmetsp:Transcript_8574/g.25424  ORF Transcript_8574/g.25424 Transcript_8574/m.25424 type:complete len:80 (+) Transcript_8574:2022-2261(+)
MKYESNESNLKVDSVERLCCNSSIRITNERTGLTFASVVEVPTYEGRTIVLDRMNRMNQSTIPQKLAPQPKKLAMINDQ